MSYIYFIIEEDGEFLENLIYRSDKNSIVHRYHVSNGRWYPVNSSLSWVVQRKPKIFSTEDFKDILTFAQLDLRRNVYQHLWTAASTNIDNAKWRNKLNRLLDNAAHLEGGTLIKTLSIRKKFKKIEAIYSKIIDFQFSLTKMTENLDAMILETEEMEKNNKYFFIYKNPSGVWEHVTDLPFIAVERCVAIEFNDVKLTPAKYVDLLNAESDI